MACHWPSKLVVECASTFWIRGASCARPVLAATTRAATIVRPRHTLVIERTDLIFFPDPVHKTSECSSKAQHSLWGTLAVNAQKVNLPPCCRTRAGSEPVVCANEGFTAYVP